MTGEVMIGIVVAANMKRKSSRKQPRSGSPLHLQRRVMSLQRRICKWQVDALLVSNPVDIRYLTGFSGDDSWALILARSRKVHLISDARFDEQIKRDAPHAVSHIRSNGLSDELIKISEKINLKNIAVQAQHFTVGQLQLLSRKFRPKRLKAVTDGLIGQRSVKDRNEITAIRQAIAIQQKAYRRALKQVTAGMTEQQVVAVLEYEMRNLGADGPSFATVVAAGANSSLPHAIPGPDKVKRGGIVLIDWGARYRGYCSDMTRVIAVGHMPAKIKAIYEVVLDAQEAGINAVKPGVSLSDVDAAARRVIERAGYGREFRHSLGHGVGLDIHEEPVLSKSVKGALVPGHVITIEPGVYVPGLGGVRIEDDVLVTARGRDVLTDLPKSLKSTII